MKEVTMAGPTPLGDCLLRKWEKKELKEVRTEGTRCYSFELSDHIRIVDNAMGPCVMVAAFERKKEFEELVYAYNYMHDRLPEHYRETAQIFPDIGLYCWRSKEYVFSRKHLFIVNSMLNFIENSAVTVRGVKPTIASKRTRDFEMQTDPIDTVNHNLLDCCGKSPWDDGYVMKKRRTLRQKMA